MKTMEGDNISTLMYAKRYDSTTKLINGVTAQLFINGEVTQIEHADTATWNGTYWVMHNGVIYDLAADGNGVERTMRFKDQILPIAKDPDQISQEQRDPDEMTIKELRQQIKALNASYVTATKWEMEMYQRFTIPIASFVFALVGAPLGLQKQRSSSSIGFGLSVIIIFVYYGVMTFTGALGKGGALPPLVAAAIPDTLGIIAGLWLNWKVSK